MLLKIDGGSFSVVVLWGMTMVVMRKNCRREKGLSDVALPCPINPRLPPTKTKMHQTVDCMFPLSRLGKNEHP